MLRDEIAEEVTHAVGDETPVCFISAATRQGVQDLVSAVAYRLAEIPKTNTSALTTVPEYGLPEGYDPLEDDNLPVVQTKGPDLRMVVRVSADSFRIVHDRAVRLAQGSNLDNWDALVQYHERLERMKVTDAIRRAGARNGDVILVGEWEFEWQ